MDKLKQIATLKRESGFKPDLKKKTSSCKPRTKAKSIERILGRLNYGPNHLSSDQMIARQKLEQLKIITTTNLAIVSATEPSRISSVVLFKHNLFDPTLNLSIVIVYLLSRCLAGTSFDLRFFLIFSCLFLVVNHHIESFKSFVIVRNCVEMLKSDHNMRFFFLSTHFGHEPIKRFNVTAMRGDHGKNTTKSLKDSHLQKRQAHLGKLSFPVILNEKTLDSFDWINEIIAFFWPYLSHLIHYELNEFFRDQIESGSWAGSRASSKRLFYAVMRQLDTNILAIEKCQLGDRSPRIRSIKAFENKISPSVKNEGGIQEPVTHKDHQAPSCRSDNTLTYDIKFEYNGDMNIAFIYRYFCCCNSRVGLKDVFVHFNARVVLGPIKREIPFVDQISFTLLDLPKFGYKGIALVELAELRVVRRVINRLMQENLLKPKFVTIGVHDFFQALLNGPPTDDPNTRHNPSGTRANVGDVNQTNVSFLTRLSARALLCGCVCSNIFLRCFQGTRRTLCPSGCRCRDTETEHEDK